MASLLLVSETSAPLFNNNRAISSFPVNVPVMVAKVELR